MDVVKEEIVQIKEILKKNPRGINVIDIASQVNMNRQTVTKYLEMLMVAGNVDVKTFGPSKVYYLSQRLPVSSMISLSSDFILILDKNLNVVNVNDSFIEFTKTKREDILSKGIDAIPFPMEFDPQITPSINDALDGNESRIDAYYKKRGKEYFYSIKFIPIAFDDGQPGATVMFEDITERKRVENRISHLASFPELNPNPIFEISVTGNIGYMNPTANKLFPDLNEKGALHPLLEGFGAMVHSFEAGDKKMMVKGVLVGGKYYQESIYYASDYKIIRFYLLDITERKRVEDELREKQARIEFQAEEMETQIEELRANNEELETQIIERKRVEEEIKKSEEKFKTLIQNLKSGVVLIEADGRFSIYNPSFFEMFGFTAEELQRMNLVDLDWKAWEMTDADGNILPVDKRPITLAFTTGKPVKNMLVSVRRPLDGKTIWTLTSAVPLTTPDGHMDKLICTFYDVTELRQAEENQKNLIRQLKESNDQLTAIMEVTERAMSTLDIEELLNSLLNCIIQVMKADASVFLLKDDDQVQVRASIGIREEARPKFSVPLGQGFAGAIALSGEPQYIEDVKMDSRIIYPSFRDIGVRSILGVPIRSRGEIIGVVHVDWMNVHPYNKQEQDFLQIIADRCGMAIVNAELYERSRPRSDSASK